MKSRLISNHSYRLSCLLTLILFCPLTTTIAGPDAGSKSNIRLARFDHAASLNSRLSFDLEWSFGGKPQRGWYLYHPLICRLIGSDYGANSREFARAVYRWQRSVGVSSTGVLNEKTWMSMVKRFQAQRIKRYKPASYVDLIQAPASDFYHRERPPELRYIDRQTYYAYKRLLEAAMSEPSLREGGNPEVSLPTLYLKLISSYRSPEYQSQLRLESPHSSRAGLAINSPHFTGRALDLYVGGDPVNSADDNREIQINTAVYRWLVKNAGRFGFYPYFYEPWHWEYRPSFRSKRRKQ
ncbi:MAG: D-alanyl-D-alanine carboxypeptidase family protein [Acidobacteria bacterium]|nr:D-alanyl-D-alanine carboxypeptidase family protein [Acidobacteriota bacterium]